MVSESTHDFQSIINRAASILDTIEERGRQPHRKLAWTVRRSRLDVPIKEEMVRKAEQAYAALFGEGHQGIRYVTSKVATQEEAHVRMWMGFENWVYDSLPRLESDIFFELEPARVNFGKSVCLVGRYCARVDSLFNSELALVVNATHECFDRPDYAATLLDFVEHLFMAGMIPLGFERTPEGMSLQVFVCD